MKYDVSAAVVVETTKRLAKVPRVFSNWAGVWAVFVTATITGRPKTMKFVSRAGTRLVSQSGITSRAAIFEVFVDDCYRMEWLLAPLVGRSPLVLDVGAHVGSFSLRVLEICPDATVHCYEPSATTAEYLRRNAAANNASITVHEAAVSAETGTALFSDTQNASTINRLDSEAAGATNVHTYSFGDVLAAMPAKPALVKLDCEGSEYDIVLRSAPEDWHGIDRLIMEYHPMPDHTWDELAGPWLPSVSRRLPLSRSVRVSAPLGLPGPRLIVISEGSGPAGISDLTSDWPS
jgi:FkbM family methyltransferase